MRNSASGTNGNKTFTFAIAPRVSGRASADSIRHQLSTAQLHGTAVTSDGQQGSITFPQGAGVDAHQVQVLVSKAAGLKDPSLIDLQF